MDLYPFLPPGAPARFPDPRRSGPDGVVAVGGDLAEERLLHGYDVGVFPWYDDDLPVIWWSPDPRTVLVPEDVHVSRRLARRMRQGRFAFAWDTAFDEVIAACAEHREIGTWITDDMRAAYTALHGSGNAHSLEVRDTAGELVGGLYGVHRGALFAAESMFHRATDASKAALVVLCAALVERGVRLVDVQMTTDHLLSMGAVEWPRSRYLDALPELVAVPVDLVEVDVSAAAERVAATRSAGA